ncbi:selenocysteine lyase/cysteine desulfurase [Prauserella sediminis]|uniref:Selenocysteine lyase/cysteine desulfurase n=1 Tax=Prauserella sediminis TaxID=577680 RepID=A0A839XWV6_9PSEU|nr:aminotransferase class V-fold PLP-dependent enzyme [Prauserella sediminis]MBB3664506.1 selenocysteine lyase/cysteine desulfurase [Prauserella sediminis]
MTPEDFRRNFPALESWTWLDTPGAPPGARTVTTTLRRALDDWDSGSYDWLDWDRAADAARYDFARWTGVSPESVASQTSLSEAATVAARCVPDGATTVVAADEFRSVLFPAMEHAATTLSQIDLVQRRPGVSRTESLVEAIGPDTGLVMVSEVLTNDGELVDIDAVCTAAHRHDGLVFANLTQSLGVIRSDLSNHPADLVAAHGYKWMLCPRGTSWLVADPARITIGPTVASWKSAADPEQFFAGPYSHAVTASRFNSSPAWLSWIGARAALELLAEIDTDASRSHVLHLADRYINRMAGAGFRAINSGARSHIVVAAPPDRKRIDPERLQEAGVRATITARGELRVGFHYFNTEADVDHAAASARSALVEHP